jgi:hypothetical protein
MARPRKETPAPVQEAKKPGRPKKAESAVDPDIDRIRDTVQHALNFINSSSTDYAERIGYLGRCLEELGTELDIVKK